MIFIIVLIVLTCLYTLISVSLIVGVNKLKKNPASSGDLPYVSILVPARNEEKSIGNCLDSLVRQDYPPDRYEIIVVNDRSTDDTPAIIKDYQEKHRMIRCVNVVHNPSNLTGKQNALNEGLKLCTGEIILNIDADCVTVPSWVRKTVSCFAPETGLVVGLTGVGSVNRSMSVFARLQAIDLSFLMDSAAGAIGIGVPVSCIGSNLAYRKAVLDELGDLRTKYNITEDTALLQGVAKKTNWKISVAYDKGAIVLASAEESLKQFLSQRIRWLLGGQSNKLWSMALLYVIFFFNLCLVIAFPLMFFMRTFTIVIPLSILNKMVLDFIRCWRICKVFGRCELLWLFLFYEAFSAFYSVIVGFGSIFIRKVRWKGDIYTKSSRRTSHDVLQAKEG